MESAVKSYSTSISTQDYIELEESYFNEYIEIHAQDEVSILIGHKLKDVSQDRGFITKDWKPYKPFSAVLYIKAPNTTTIDIITNRVVHTLPMQTISPRTWDDTQHYGQYRGETWM